jgi:hypothetical protein
MLIENFVKQNVVTYTQTRIGIEKTKQKENRKHAQKYSETNQR